MTLRPKGALNAKKITGGQESSPSCNKETVGNTLIFLIDTH